MTELPSVDEIWSDRYRTRLWHDLWIRHLRLQGADPSDIELYEMVAANYRDNQEAAASYDRTIVEVERRTRHEVVAHLDVFNRVAGRTLAHRGLASSDIVDVANQRRIADSLAVIVDHAIRVADKLRGVMVEHAGLKMIARTHGQRAELTTYGHRQATILAPLLDWIDRTVENGAGYPMRPPYGAVGTAADLKRVLDGQGLDGEVSSDASASTGEAFHPRRGVGTPPETFVPTGDMIDEYTDRLAGPSGGWGPVDQYSGVLAAQLGFLPIMDATRQVYHRSYDLRIASLIAELASIAQTWATDRRLESALGQGHEAHEVAQSASSSMPQKNNPRLSERICALAVVTRSHLAAVAEMAGMEWLEGDVSTSAARKLILPALFSNIDAVLANWLRVAQAWQPNLDAIEHEARIYRYQWATPAIMELLIEHGVSRPQAHDLLREVWSRVCVTEARPEFGQAQFETLVTSVLVDRGIKITVDQETTRARLRRVTDEMLRQPVGNVPDQIDYLDRRTTRTLSMASKTAWAPQVRA